MAAPLKTNPQTFDEAKLQAMTDPLTVRVERIKGGTRMPIPMPEPDDGSAPGTNFDKDTIRGLEQWLVTEWAGGGLFEIMVTDSVGQVMKWRPFWNTQEYPEKVPPPLEAARSAGIVPLPVNPIQPLQVRQPMVAFPNGLPAGYSTPAVPHSYYPPMPAAPPVGTPQFVNWQAEADRRAKDEELKSLREEKDKARELAIESRHKAQLDAERTANQQQHQRHEAGFNDLRTMIANLASAIKEGTTASRPNLELEAMREQARRAETERDRERAENAARAERERQEREADRRDRELRETLRAMNEGTQRQIDAITKLITDAAANNNRMDPIMSLLKEQARENAEAIKEVSRNFSTQIQQLSGMIMRPAEVLAMAKESSASSSDTVTKVSQLMTGIIDVQRQSFESIMQMQPNQGTGAIDVVRDGVNGLKELAERYVGVQQMNATVQKASVEAQARAFTEIEKEKIRVSAGLGGQPVAATSQAQAPQPQTPAAATPDAVIGKGTNKKKASKIKRLGRTDLEWFGPILPHIEELREAVKAFVESLKTNPPTVNKDGQHIGVIPPQAVQAIIMGVQQTQAMNVVVPAMTDLLFQHRHADFIDILLPDAPQAYRDDTVKILVEAVRRMGGEEPYSPEAGDQPPSEDDDTDDADDADDDEDQDGKPVAAPRKPQLVS